MKKTLAILLSLAICVMAGCNAGNTQSAETEATAQITLTQETIETTVPTATEGTTVPTEDMVTNPTEASASETEDPPATVPQAIAQPETETPATETTSPTETDPPATTPPQTEHDSFSPPSYNTEETAPTETTSTETDPQETEPEPFEPMNQFKREVAAYVAQYINQYRGSPCTVLPGMTRVAEYRADQLCYNFSHSTSDKRAALAYYEYGRWIDATEAGLDASLSYYESDTSEAICRGARGADAEAIGKAIADMIRSSGSHWAYVGSSEYSFMGVGVEYRDDSYGWYACVMVGTVNYG